MSSNKCLYTSISNFELTVALEELIANYLWERDKKDPPYRIVTCIANSAFKDIQKSISLLEEKPQEEVFIDNGFCISIK